MGVPVPCVNKATRWATPPCAASGRKGMRLRPEFKLVAGRMFRPGKRELIVGAGAQGQFAGTADRRQSDPARRRMAHRRRLHHRRHRWKANCSATRETLMTATAQSTYNTVLVRLAVAGSVLHAFKARPDHQSGPVGRCRNAIPTGTSRSATDNTSAFVRAIAYVVGAVMAIGALFGCLNTMYAAVASRGREIATFARWASAAAGGGIGDPGGAGAVR